MAMLKVITLLLTFNAVKTLIVNERVLKDGTLQAPCKEHQLTLIVDAAGYFEGGSPAADLNYYCQFHYNCSINIYKSVRRRFYSPFIIFYSCLEKHSVRTSSNKTLSWSEPDESILTSAETGPYDQPCLTTLRLNPGQVVAITALSVLPEVHVNNKVLHKRFPTMLTADSTMTYTNVERTRVILLYTVVVSRKEGKSKVSVDDDSPKAKKTQTNIQEGEKTHHLVNVEKNTLNIQHLSVGGLSLGVLILICLLLVLAVSILTLHTVNYIKQQDFQSINATQEAGLYETTIPPTQAQPASVYTALNVRKGPESRELYSNV